MPSWKKVIISGSNAELTSLYAPSITGSLQGTASFASTASNVQGGTARYIPIWNTSSSLSSSAIYQSATGDVGIGTTTPSAKLDVSGSFRFGPTGPGSVYFRSWDYGTDMDISSVNVGGWSRTHRIITSDTGGAVYFGVYGNTTTSERAYWTIGPTGSLETGYTFTKGVHLLKNGNIGIGTYVPSAKLHITNTSTSASFIVEDDTQTDATSFVIDATGNVGIGTLTPYAKLTVQTSGSDDNLNAMIANFGKSPSSTGYGSTFIRVARSTATTTLTGSADYTDIEHNSAGGTPHRYGTFGDTNIINGGRYTAGKFGSINFVTSGSIGMTIAGGTSAGRVGIGTTSPNATLDVNGNTIITGSLTVTNGLTVNNTLFTSTTATANVGSTTIYSVSTSSYDGAWFEYVARSGSNARAGQIMAIDSGSAVNFTETTTTDFGSTSGLSLGVYIVNGAMALTASAATNGWSIKTIVRSI